MLRDEIWTPLQLFTQHRMHELSDWLGTHSELISDGRYISLYMSATTEPELAVEAVETFGRAMICGPRRAVEKVITTLKSNGFEVNDNLSCLSGEAVQVLRLSEKFCREFAIPPDLTVHDVADISDGDIGSIQRLQALGGLVPLPRNGIFHARATSMIARDAASEIVGFSSVIGLESERKRRGWFQVGGVCVATSHRGLGLGTYLTAKTILQATKARSAQTIICSVEAENTASIKMHFTCGFHSSPDYSFIFSRVSRDKEQDFLAQHAL